MRQILARIVAPIVTPIMLWTINGNPKWLSVGLVVGLILAAPSIWMLAGEAYRRRGPYARPRT